MPLQKVLVLEQVKYRNVNTKLLGNGSWEIITSENVVIVLKIEKFKCTNPLNV
jgi:hypothetical protein